jgi:hypothetical protein
MWNAIESSALRHAFQQYNDAVRCLARGDEPLYERLKLAWAYSITHVRTENLPESIRKKAEKIHTWMERVDDSNFTEEAGPGLADDIVKLYTEIAQESANSPSASSSSPPNREPAA